MLFLAWRIAFLNIALLSLQILLGAPLVKGGEVRSPWQAEWEKTVKAAEEEGEVVIYSTQGLDLVFREAFQRKHPRIKVNTVIGKGFQLGQRVMSERRAGKYIADLFVMGSFTPFRVFYLGKALDPIKSLLILPEVVDESNWFQGKHHYIDPERRYIFMFEGTPRSGEIIYNSNLVNLSEFRSYWDLLNPKWKGKIAGLDPLVAGPISSALIFFHKHPDLGPEFLKRFFTETDITIVRSDEQLADWLGVGKFALGFGVRRVELAMAQGLPLNRFPPEQMKEGSSLSAYNGTLSFFNQAPHPNAAKVAINWLLSREGQMTWLEYNFKSRSDYDSMREDIPKDKVSPRGRRVEGVKYLLTDRPEWMDMKPIYDLIKKALAETKKP